MIRMDEWYAEIMKYEMIPRRRGNVAAYSRWRAERRKKMGICWCCSSPVKEGHTFCGKHLENLNERCKRIESRARLAGLCRCGNLPKTGLTRCARCSERRAALRNNRRRNRRSNGLCAACGAKSSGYYCRTHAIQRRIYKKTYRARRKARGKP